MCRWPLQSLLLFITRTRTLVLASGGVEVVFHGQGDAAHVVDIALIIDGSMTLQVVAVLHIPENILGSQADAELVVTENLGQADVQMTAYHVKIDLLIVALALIGIQDIPCKRLGNLEVVVESQEEHGLVIACLVIFEPLLVHCQGELRTVKAEARRKDNGRLEGLETLGVGT